MRTLCLDFDGVLHEYTGPYQGDEVVNGAVIPGAVAFCEEALRHFDAVVVNSVRCRSREGIRAIAAWLDVNGFPAEMKVVATKPPAIVYIDDRGFRFDGTFPNPATLLALTPWNR